MRRLPYRVWVKRFEPIRNPYDDHAAIDGCLFQPYGPQWDFVRKAPDGHVWTLTVTDLSRGSVWHISDGIHIVNREGYLVTRKCADPKTSYSVRY